MGIFEWFFYWGNLEYYEISVLESLELGVGVCLKFIF